MALSEQCPHCRVELAYIADDGKTYSRTLMVEVNGVYDGGLFYQCPDCYGRWHRWPPGHYLRKRAHRFVVQTGHALTPYGSMKGDDEQ